MFAGKTAMLIDKFKRYKSQETVLLKHSCDTRYSNDYVVSRNGESFSATAVSELLCNGETMFGDRYKNLAVIGIDEGQFFPNIANCAHQWALQGKNVIITAIKTGIYMEPIQAIAELAAIADLETQLRTGCRHCAGLALFTY